METSYGHNQLTINSDICKDNARGLGKLRSIHFALKKQNQCQMTEMQRHI